MNIYSTLPEQVTGKLLAQLNEDCKICNSSSQADIAILIRKSGFGGIDTPTLHIKNPLATIIIAGTPDLNGEKFADEAVNCGVPEGNIFFLPKGQVLSLKILTDKMAEILSKLNPTESEKLDEEWVPLFEDDTPSITALNQERRKITHVIACLSYKGGVGRTTIATSLLAHYQDTGEQSCLLDLSWPSTSSYHIMANSYEEKNNVLICKTKYGALVMPKVPIYRLGVSSTVELINMLRNEYRRVLIDLPTYPSIELVQAIGANKTIVFVNHDITQVVEPTAHILTNRTNHIFVYNRTIPEVEPEMVSAYLNNINVEIIPTDMGSCIAALAAGQPANLVSKEIAKAIGRLAAIIDNERGGGLS